MFNVQETLDSLLAMRPIFHSEADFQHALAWEIHKKFPQASVRLELPVKVNQQSLHIDIWVVTDVEILAIELKYKTKMLTHLINNEQFKLKDQRAQDIGRYDFIKDIQRLEYLALDRRNVTGYAILLTNDPSYWQNSSSSKTVDAELGLQDGRILGGHLNWGDKASDGTRKNREQTLFLKGKYTLDWKDFSIVEEKANGVFRQLTVQVEKSVLREQD